MKNAKIHIDSSEIAKLNKRTESLKESVVVLKYAEFSKIINETRSDEEISEINRDYALSPESIKYLTDKEIVVVGLKSFQLDDKYVIYLSEEEIHRQNDFATGGELDSDDISWERLSDEARKKLEGKVISRKTSENYIDLIGNNWGIILSEGEIGALNDKTNPKLHESLSSGLYQSLVGEHILNPDTTKNSPNYQGVISAVYDLVGMTNKKRTVGVTVQYRDFTSNYGLTYLLSTNPKLNTIAIKLQDAYPNTGGERVATHNE